MNDKRYLLDTVSVTRISLDVLMSDFVQEKCVVPAEVYYEVGSAGKREAIQRIAEAPSASLFGKVRDLLLSAGVNNQVLDLYQNQGNGDIILVATALSKEESEELSLFKTKWTIVSDDKNLQDLAQINQILVISTEAFKERLRKHQHQLPAS